MLVIMRKVQELPSLGSDRARRAILEALAVGRERFGFRAVQFGVHGGELRLLCEADDRRALARGMQGLSIRMAKALNRAWRRDGRVFGDRYEARSLRTVDEVRDGIAYVLEGALFAGSDATVAPPRGWLVTQLREIM